MLNGPHRLGYHDAIRGQRTARFVICFLILGSLCAFAIRQSVATTWMPPLHPLTQDEQLEKAIGESQFIGVGTVVAGHDSIAPDGMLWRWIVFRPRRWLKGSASTHDVRTYFSQISDCAYRQVLSWKGTRPLTSLVFIRQLSNSKLAIAEEPDNYGCGILRVTSSPGLEEAKVIAAIVRQTPEEVARRSDLIVVGRTTDKWDTCSAYGRHTRCTEVQVDSVIAGTAPTGPLRVYGRYGGLFVPARSPGGLYPPVMLMLRSSGGRGYEVVGFSSGVLTITGNKVDALHATIGNVAARLRKARSAVK